MSLRLDPRHTLLWRTPDSLQLGADHPVATLDGVSDADARMIAALAIGVTRPGLELVAERSGAGPLEVEALLARLQPALTTMAPTGPAPVVEVGGTSATAARVRFGLEQSGFSLSSETNRESTAIAVIVTQFVVTPDDHHRWLHDDVPHLPVVLGDTSVRIGPVVEPGRSACLVCIHLHAVDADPAWPAIAAQLWQRESHAETPIVIIEVAAAAARMVAERLADGAAEHATSVTIDAASGERTTRSWQPHPACGCGAHARIGSPAVRPLRHHERMWPTTAAAALEPA